MQNADLKAPEGRNIGNKSTPSVFLAPEGRNIGKKPKSPMEDTNIAPLWG